MFGSDRSPVPARTGVRGGRFWLRQRAWSAAAALLLLVGSGAAVVAASVASRRDANEADAAFRSSSGQVASSLKLAIQHEQDLMTSTSACCWCGCRAAWPAQVALPTRVHRSGRWLLHR